MRTPVFVLFLFVFHVAAKAGSVTVYIVPAANSIPASGEVAFDVYWYNDSDRAAKIPAFERFGFTFYALTPPAEVSREAHTEVSLEARTVDHSGPDRSIAPRAIVHDQTTITIHAKPDELVVVSATFYGNKSRFKSNTIVLGKVPET